MLFCSHSGLFIGSDLILILLKTIYVLVLDTQVPVSNEYPRGGGGER